MTDAQRHHGEPPVPDEAGADAAVNPDDTSEPDASADAPGDSSGDGEVHGTGLAVEEDVRTPEELRAELVEAEARRDEYLDDLRRARAEFENFRRRTMREGATQRELGKGEVLDGLLEVLDDLDRTLEAADASEDASLAKGIGIVAGKLVQALQSQGLERIDETGVPFDPNQHEAVQQVEGDADEPTVAQVLRPGYRAGDRVLRAAMVVVEQ